MAAEAKCSVDGCGNPLLAKGFCRKHYSQIYRKGEIQPDKEERQKAEGVKCTVDGCEKDAHANGYCRKHYGELYRRGKIRPVEKKRQATEKLVSQNDGDRIRALERELERAETMYRNVVGVEGRLKWRREVEELRKDRDRLGIAPSAPVATEIP